MSRRLLSLALLCAWLTVSPVSAGQSRPDAPPSAEAATPVRCLPDEESPGGRHVVAPGETLSAIAAHGGIDLAALERANPGLDARRLAVGRVLVIPPPRPSGPPPVAVSRPGPAGEAAPLVMDFR